MLQTQPVQQMRRRSSLLTSVFPFKKGSKSTSLARSLLTPLASSSCDLSISRESVSFVPNYVEVRVLQATGIPGKGKDGTTNAFATVAIGKEKFETSVIEKGIEPFSWEYETIMFEISERGNMASINIGIYHRKRIADECLGVSTIFLREFQPSPVARRMSCTLHSKSDPRAQAGEVTISVAFRTSRESCDESWDGSFGGSCRTLNILNEDFEDFRGGGGMRKRSNSFGRGLAETLGILKPIQYVTPVIQVSGTLDQEEREWESNFKKVESARGRINALHDVEESFRIDENEEDDENSVGGRETESENSHSDSDVQSEDNDDDVFNQNSIGKEVDQISKEFKGETKENLIRMILSLREVIKEQDEKISDLQTYIDTRLVTILDSNPEALEKSADASLEN